MEKLAYVFTAYLIKRNVVAEEKRCIYEYGFQIGLEVCLNTIISILIAIACGMESEAVIFFYVFIALRSYAGGLHLKSYFSCMLCSCLSFLLLLLIVKYTDFKIAYSIMAEGAALLLIKYLAPIQDVNRPLEQDEIVVYSSKLNIVILKILFLSFIFCSLKLYNMLQMISVTTVFMVGILILGKIRYIKAIRDN